VRPDGFAHRTPSIGAATQQSSALKIGQRVVLIHRNQLHDRTTTLGHDHPLATLDTFMPSPHISPVGRNRNLVHQIISRHLYSLQLYNTLYQVVRSGHDRPV
jgi:hypothetical protein